jgi:hypothetical protein
MSLMILCFVYTSEDEEKIYSDTAHAVVGLLLSMKLWIVKGFHDTNYCIEIISQRTLYLVWNISDGG